MKHLHSSPLLSGLAFLALLLISSSTACAQSDDRDRGPASRSYTLDERVKYQLWNYSWHPDETQPITKIVVHIKEQRVYVYQGDKLAGWSPTATGKPGHETPYGTFEVMAKDIDHKSTLFGSFVDGVTGQVVNNNAEAGMAPPPGTVYDAANMPYYLRITGSGVGFHAGYLPGYAASHGCIRLPHRFAELLYWNVALGTPVEITD